MLFHASVLLAVLFLIVFPSVFTVATALQLLAVPLKMWLFAAPLGGGRDKTVTIARCMWRTIS